MTSYIDLINRFWRLDNQYAFSGEESRLYFYLLKVANEHFPAWPESFSRADKKVAADNRQVVNSMKKYRDRLIEVGLIGFVGGGEGRGNLGSYAIRYQNLTPCTIEKCQEMTPKKAKKNQILTPSEGLERCQEKNQILTPNTEKVSGKESNFDTNSYIIEKETFLSNDDVKTEVEKGPENPLKFEPQTAPFPPTPLSPELAGPLDRYVGDELGENSEITAFYERLLSDSKIVEGTYRYLKQVGPALTLPEVKELLNTFALEQWEKEKLENRSTEDLRRHVRYWIDCKRGLGKIKPLQLVNLNTHATQLDNALNSTNNGNRSNSHHSNASRYGQADYETAFGLVDAFINASS